MLRLWKIDLADDEMFGWSVLCFPVTQRRWTSVGLEDVSPGNPGFRPSRHSAVQLESVALPDSLPTGHDDKLWMVCQAVWVHFLTELGPLLHLQQESEDRFSR